MWASRIVWVGVDPLAAAAPIRWSRADGTFESTIPEGAESAWFALVVAGRVEDAARVTNTKNSDPNNALLVELAADLSAIERAAGAVELSLRDTATGAAPNAAALAGLTVRFAESGGARLGLVRHDPAGFVFGPLRAGVYDVTISAPGFAAATRAQFVVTAGRVAELAISLDREKR